MAWANRCSGHGPCRWSASECSGVTYPLCSANPYSGWVSCSSHMIRSRVTFAITLAAATHAATWSPFQTANPGVPSPSTGNPSVSTYDGRTDRLASDRRSAATLHTCSPRVSTSPGGMRTAAHANATRTTSS